MHVSTTVRYHLAPVRIPSIKDKKQVLARMGRKGHPPTLPVGMQAGAATVENSMGVPQDIKNRNPVQASNSATGYLSEETENTNWKISTHSCFYGSIVDNSQGREVTRVSISR